MAEAVQGRAGKLIDSYRESMVSMLSEMIGIKAVSPASGGDGEAERADFLEKKIRELGVEAKRYAYRDDSGVDRPSIVATYGSAERTLWLMPHMDTVSEGDLGLWKRDPFTAAVEGDMVYGRGTNDDGQDVVSSIFALKALKELGPEPKFRLGLAIVADEELGSRYGIEKLIEEPIFSKNDMFIVPDSGNAEGTQIEIGEKGILWLRITVEGKQVHASTPEYGVNAKKLAARFLLAADELLHSKYPAEDRVFNPPRSTFEMTKQEKNVDSINIIPGKDVSYIDCRVLPQYRLDDIIADVRALADRGEFKDARIEVEAFNREDPAPVSDRNSILSKRLVSVLQSYGIEPRFEGIGGGTCAAFTRKKGMETVVWSKKDDIAHQPNEYARISDMLLDTKVFTLMFL